MPYFNEPGYERSIGTPEGDSKNKHYNSDVRLNNIKYAMLAHLKTPDPIFGDVITAHFKLRRDFIMQQCEKWVSEETGVSKTAAMKAATEELKTLLAKLV